MAGPDQLVVTLWCTVPEFTQQVHPLGGQLSCSLRNPQARAGTPELPRVERVPATARLRMHRSQVLVQRLHWTRLLPESRELGMVPVAPGAAAEHRPGEERLAPESHQPEGVQVLRVHGPEPHS